MEIKYIEPSALHDEMLRLRKEKQMDFLECLSGKIGRASCRERV